jgi:eukaryotic-like serine/threonine-protein kinase
VSAPPVSLVETLRDRYRVERELGRGGMAMVWLAQDLRHDRPVAIKVLRPELSAMLGVERFLREIQLTAKLQHPHILPLLDSGEAQGVLYYVMPFVEGESLRQRLQRERQLSVEEALRITRGVATALAYAHEQGVIHRDIKPENILLYRGEPMVADFGIALAAAAAGGERLTETGLSLGTPAYMSPEQASAPGTLDGRTDQYSLACVVYEMLAGEPPYTGTTAQAIIAKRFSEPVPHVSTLRAVPAAVDVAVTRALAKAPADRFLAMAEFVTALERLAPARKPGRRWAALLGGVAALGAVATLGFLLRPSHAVRPMTTRQLTFTSKARAPALSPDGGSIAYVSGNRALLVQRVDGGEPVVLVPPTRFADNPRWTPDGRDIVVVLMRDSSELAATWVVPSGGGPARKVMEEMVPLDAGKDPAIARIPHGKHYVELMDWRTGRAMGTVPLPDSVGGSGYDAIAWSPDRRWFGFEDRGAVWVVSAAGGAPVRVSNGWSPRWGPGSDALYYLAGPSGAEVLFKTPLDVRSGTPLGPRVRLVPLPGATSFDLRGNRLMYTRTSASRQVRVLRVGGTPRRVLEDRFLTTGSARVTGVSISGDGRSVAYSQARGDREDIYVTSFDGGDTRQIAGTTAPASAPALSPDGSRLAYVLRDSSASVVMVADLRGGSSQRVGSLPPGTERDRRPRWSADGRHLAYFGADLHRGAVIDIDRQTERVLAVADSIGTAYGEVVPAPDGRAVIASTLRRWSDWGELWTSATDTVRWQSVRGPFGESNPIAWTVDGWTYLVNHRVLQTDYGALRYELWRTRQSPASPELVVPLPEGCVQADVSADASRIACVNLHDDSDIYVATDFDQDLR